MDEKMEIYGALFLGYTQACINLKIVAGIQAVTLAEGIQNIDWYPLERWKKIGEIIADAYENPGPIMEKVGIEMMAAWYNYGPGRNLIKKGSDFLLFQTGSEGYKSVVRGPFSFIGDFKLLSFDDRNGRAVIESSTPFSRDLERGVLIGGMKAPGDLEYIEVSNDLNKDVFLINFQKITTSACFSFDNKGLTAEEQKDLLIKYRALVIENNRNIAFWESTNRNLEKITLNLDALNEKLKEQSLTDPLTGLRNRRYFDEIVSEYAANFLKLKTLEEVKKRSSSVNDKIIGIFLIDIDFFKKVNDSHGHKAGDFVLKEVSKIFLNIIRFDDICIRWGGEEFLIILDKADIEYLPVFAKKCNSVIKENKFQISDNIVSDISVSIGYSAYPFYTQSPDKISFEQCVGICDHGLYIAKNEGRNRSIGIYENKISEDYSVLNHNLELYENDKLLINESFTVIRDDE